MGIENKVNEYKEKFDRLKLEDPDKYNRIRLYINACVGVEQENYKAAPQLDLIYLHWELTDLVREKPEYSIVAQGLYDRMNNIVYQNKE